ncbi:unnamed protein product [Peronospora farinosa]|uniref:Peptidase A2 domain-containing protein n=1 Tax=Peronospora farinosa TaxID=134698 RepID=A0ABN8CJZ4_9STRA|nr:unnamed protein product [Peronospora farinosa]
MMLELLPGESRGYWKHHAPKKWFKQKKGLWEGQQNLRDLLFDSGAEVSISDTAFAREDALLEMDFMVPAGIRLDMADGTICLQDKVRMQMAGRKTLSTRHISEVKSVQYVKFPATKYVEVPLKRFVSDQ